MKPVLLLLLGKSYLVFFIATMLGVGQGGRKAVQLYNIIKDGMEWYGSKMTRLYDNGEDGG